MRKMFLLRTTLRKLLTTTGSGKLISLPHSALGNLLLYVWSSQTGASFRILAIIFFITKKMEAALYWRKVRVSLVIQILFPLLELIQIWFPLLEFHEALICHTISCSRSIRWYSMDAFLHKQLILISSG